MPQHNLEISAAVIATRNKGESNREYELLTPDAGIIRATVYAARKSSRTSKVPLFSFGTFYLTNNPSTGIYTLSDVKFAPCCPFEFDLPKIGIASFLCETAKAIGESDCKSTFDLLTDALLTLSMASDANEENRVLIQFVWQMVKNGGNVGDLCSCPSCRRQYSDSEILFYNRSTCFFCCEKCADDRAFFLPPGARRYLTYTAPMDFRQAYDVLLSNEASQRIKKIMISYASLLCDGRLKTVESGLL